MKYERIEDVPISKDSMVRVKEMGAVTEITYQSNQNTQAQTIKISSDEYVVASTGEVKQYENKSENRSQNTDSVRKTLRRVRELIQTNIADTSKVRWCTFTYAENMTDTEKLYNDFRKFNQKFQRYLKRRNIEKAEYISIAEPQSRGAWHLHVLYIFQQKAPYIANDKLYELWSHGFTKIKALDDITNVTAYLIPYLSDMEIPIECKDWFDAHKIKEAQVDGQTKAFLKGQRLKLYPAGFNIIRHSKGIKYPQAQDMPLHEALQLVADKQQKLSYHTAFRLTKDDYETIIDRSEYR